MWQMLVSWFKQRWQSGSLFKTTELSWWSSGHKYQRGKKISENYLNHSISILSDNYHLSIEEETEMKGEYHWSHACSTVIMSGIFTAFLFFSFSSSSSFPIFFSTGEKKQAQQWNGEITGILANTYTLRVGIWTRLEGGQLWGIKRKGSFHAGRSLDSLLSRGWRGPIRLLVDPFGTLVCRWLGCGRRQAPLSALISI